MKSYEKGKAINNGNYIILKYQLSCTCTFNLFDQTLESLT